MWLLLSMLQYNFLYVWTQVSWGKSKYPVANVFWHASRYEKSEHIKGIEILFGKFILKWVISHITQNKLWELGENFSSEKSSICSSEYGTHAAENNILLISTSGARSYHKINAMGHTNMTYVFKAKNAD